MKILLLAMTLAFSTQILSAESNCKTLKSCADWATSMTGIKYDTGKLEKRSLKLEKDFDFMEGRPDFIFNFILQTNNFLKLKREDGTYQIVSTKEFKDFQLPKVLAEEIPMDLDFYSCEFSLGNKSKLKNAMIVVKKALSKNGRVLEVSDSLKINVVETGIQLNAVKMLVNELNK